MNYIPIRSYDNYISANMVLGVLKEAGIICHIKDEYTVTIDPLLSPALGGMKLMVEESDVEKALELLKESDRRFLETVACPSCGQFTLIHVIETIRFPSWPGRLRSLLVNGQEQEIRKFYRCTSCNNTMDELPASS